MTDTVMIVDQYQRYADSRKKGYRVDVKNEARQLARWLEPFGQDHRRLAIVYQSDHEGMKAYTSAGFQTVSVNGNRPEELPRIITSEVQAIKRHHPNQMVIVSDDTAFGPLCASVDEDQTKISIWSPTGDIPKDLRHYDARRLDDLVQTRIEVDKWMVFIDYENIHISLEKQQYVPRPSDIIRAIDAVIGEGNVLKKVAYADWDVLESSARTNGFKREDDKATYQRQLTELGVKTRFQVNLGGKNSADMEIVSDIHSLLSTNDDVNVIAIVTHDRDFRPVVEDIKANKKAVIMALEGNLSRELEVAADEIRYLDTHLKLKKKGGRHSQLTQTKRFDAKHPQFLFALALAKWLRAMQWKWAYRDRLMRQLDNIGTFTEEDVLTAIEDDLLVEGNRPNGLMLNPEHPIGAAANQLNWSLRRQIEYGLKKRSFEYVDTKFMAVGMQRDYKLQSLGIGQSRFQVEQILDAADQVGLLIKETRPHPNCPEKQITTWWLPDQRHQAPLVVNEVPDDDSQNPVELIIETEITQFDPEKELSTAV